MSTGDSSAGEAACMICCAVATRLASLPQRGCERLGRSCHAEQLQAFAAGTRWRSGVLRLVRHSCAVSLGQWKAYVEDYRKARGE